MERLDKRYRIQDAAIALFHEQGIETTSVNDIVKRASVAKGTFYLYYKDKQELISQILIKQYGNSLNELLNSSYEIAHTTQNHWGICFVNEMIEFYLQHQEALKMIHKNITVVLDTQEHRKLVFEQIDKLNDFLSVIKRDHEEVSVTLNRFMLIMEILDVVCYNAIFFHQPDTMEHILPELKRTLYCMLESEACL
ncbi:MAG: TetR/AcrR family transcriptional regulator [Longicatena sp.]